MKSILDCFKSKKYHTIESLLEYREYDNQPTILVPPIIPIIIEDIF